MRSTTVSSDPGMDGSSSSWPSLEKWRFAAPVPPEHLRGLSGCSSMPSPDEIVRTAAPGQSVVGWKLDRGQRTELLARFKPVYGNVVADHVTLASKVAQDAPLP